MDGTARRPLTASESESGTVRVAVPQHYLRYIALFLGGILVLVLANQITARLGIQRELALQRAEISALRSELRDVERDLRRVGYERDQMLRIELQTWRSLARSDLDYILATLKAAGVNVPPLNADTRPPFDAAIRAAEQIHANHNGANQ